MKSKFKYLISAFISWLVLFYANLSFAQLVPSCSGASCTPCHVLQLISRIARFLAVDVMVPLAGLLFLIGGIIMIASAGSEERYKKGRKIIIDTAIGAVIVLISWVVVNALITTIGTQTGGGFSPQQWWQPPMCN